MIIQVLKAGCGRIIAWMWIGQFANEQFGCLCLIPKKVMCGENPQPNEGREKDLVLMRWGSVHS